MADEARSPQPSGVGRFTNEEYSLLVIARYTPALGLLTDSQRQMVEDTIRRNLEASLFQVSKVELVKEI